MELLDQTKFGIRVMTIDDYEKVYALWMSCKNMGFNNLDDSREGIAKYLKRNPSTCFVASFGSCGELQETRHCDRVAGVCSVVACR